MKKLLFVVIVSLISLVSNAQSVYRATMAELYLYNENTKDWVLDTKQSDLKIDITVEEEFISIHAKSPTMYRVFVATKENISSKTLKGYRYSGVDLKSGDNVRIDIMRSTESSVGVVSIINSSKGYNFRYFFSVD